MLSNAWLAWRLPAWDLHAFRDMPVGYRWWVSAVPVMQMLFSAWAVSALSTSWSSSTAYVAVACAITAALSQTSMRDTEVAEFPFEQAVGLALIIAGRPLEGVICTVVGAGANMLRKPVPIHVAVLNCTHALSASLLAALAFGFVSGSSPVVSGPWLLGALAAWVSLSAMAVFSYDVTFILGRYASFRENLEGYGRSLASSLVSVLPQAAVIGVALRQESAWYLATLFVPFLVSRDVFMRSEQVVQARLSTRKMQDTFSQYVPASVVDQLVESGEDLELGGAQRDITVLFMDIRGFTAWSEQHPPTYIVERLNQLLTTLTDCVFATEGTLDKFTGDGLMAFWGAPLEQSDHAARAHRSACLMLEALANYNAGRPAAEQFRLGIGVHSGSAVVGNVGHDRRHDYTAIGDTVNLTARVEAATKDLAVQLLISRATYDLLPQELAAGVVSSGSITVKGRKAPVEVFRPTPDELAA
jgi:class 3 adenylate cyclase